MEKIESIDIKDTLYENEGFYNNPRIGIEYQDSETLKVVYSTIESCVSKRKVELTDARDSNAFAIENENAFVIPDEIPNKSIRHSKDYFISYQSYKGQVIQLKSNKFQARLVDLTEGGNDEYIWLDIDEVTPDDLKYLSDGAIFYWTLGNNVRKGTYNKQSLLRFQRLKPWTEEDIDRASDRAEYWFTQLKEE